VLGKGGKIMGLDRNRIRQLGYIGAILVTLSGCSEDKSFVPPVAGAPPEFLAGVWTVRDSVTDSRYAIGAWEPTYVYVDTICPTTLDLVEENMQTVWLMYLDEIGWAPGHFLRPEIQSCSGIISDTLINVLCRGTGAYSLTGPDCVFQLTFSTRGLPNGDEWVLLRTVQRLEWGYDCGFTPRDTLFERYTFMSVLERIGDAPDACSDREPDAISKRFYDRLMNSEGP
jgi:hypothetical protein